MRRICLALAILFFLTALSGCMLSVDGSRIKSYDRPSTGPSVEGKISRSIIVDGQSTLKLDMAEGDIKLSSWDGDYVKAAIVEKLKGPFKKTVLTSMMENYKVDIEKNLYEIEMKTIQPEEMKPLTRFTADVELEVPHRLANINITAVNGNISISGFENAGFIDLSLSSGSISVRQCKAERLVAAITRGMFSVNGFKGKSIFKAAYADAKLVGISGVLNFDSISGNTDIIKFQGKTDCNISSGTLDFKESFIQASSALYMTSGSINLDLSGLDDKGLYEFRTANGPVRLMLPAGSGFNIKAETTSGIIRSDFKPCGKTGSFAAERELAGSVGNGGAGIDIYSDTGNILIERKPG